MRATRHDFLRAAGALFLWVALAALPARAVGPAAHYVRTDDMDVARILPPPPAAGTPAAVADLDAVLQAQEWRTPDQVAWARRVAAADLFDFADVIGPWFTSANLPVTAALLRDVDADLDGAIDAGKRHFARPRPFKAEPRITPCVKLPHEASYPSGHAVGFYVAAAVLSEIFPEKRAQLLDFAQKLAWGRVIGGVHYPTDIAAGQILAAAIVERLDAAPAFKAEVGRCRDEVLAFRRLGAGAAAALPVRSPLPGLCLAAAAAP